MNTDKSAAFNDLGNVCDFRLGLGEIQQQGGEPESSFICVYLCSSVAEDFTLCAE
jgi:hypothetical protein